MGESIRVGDSRKLVLTQYSLETRTFTRMMWTKCDRMNGYNGFILTNDGRYLVHFGGVDYSAERQEQDNGEISDIVVFDMQKQTVVTSSIKCPLKGRYEAVTLGSLVQDELAVFGFVRQCFKAEEMKIVPALPIYIIEMMSKWYCNDIVYVIASADLWSWDEDTSETGRTKTDRNHYKADIDMIIRSTS